MKLTVRDRIFVLLTTAILLGALASGASLWALSGVAGQGREVVQIEFQVNQALGRVAAGHLEQIEALEWVLLGDEDEAGASDARANFEDRAAGSWAALKDVRTLLSTGDREQDLGLLASVAALDAAHNEYAARSREVFAALARRDRIEARRHAAGASEASSELKAALETVMAAADDASMRHLAELATDQQRAMGLIAGLSLGAIVAGLGIIWRAWQLVNRLQSLSGLLPICASCKSIRDDRGYWNQLEQFVEEHSEAQFTHGLCDPCMGKLKAEAKAA